MNVRPLLRALSILVLGASLHACKSEQPGKEPPPAGPTGEAAPAAPAASDTPATAPPLATGHAPEPATLPEGHPPIGGTAPAADALSLGVLLTPVVLLASPLAPTTTVSPDTATDWPK